jgi:thiol:disulfide interchange protein
MRFLIVLLFTVVVFTGYCQQTAVKWSATIQKTGGQKFEIRVSGSIENGWYVYGKELKIDGFDPLHLEFEKSMIQLNGPLKVTGKALFFHDPVLSINTTVYKQEILLSQPVIITDTTTAYITATTKGYAASGTEFLPIEETLRIKLREQVATGNNDELKHIDLSRPVANCGNNETASKGSLQLFFLGFIGGLIALLTPCVFPMIPVTVSFFTNTSPPTLLQEERGGRRPVTGVKNGMLYGSFIFLIYITASVPFHLLGNISPEIFNTISTNAWVNVFFFAVFIFFALSFFGLFEIRMPSAISNLAGTKGSLGNMSGIFFMALTLATVSFSCTGPILGSLLVGSLSSQGGAWQLSFGMAGFGAALALPFALFAMFPEWMKRLPKSGGWMDTVKKILAFVELGLAIKFLSNADLVQHWGILKREVFIGLWVVIAIALSTYLLNSGWQLRKTKIHASRIWMGLGSMCLLFAVYLSMGLTNSKQARLSLLSGFPPPLTYSAYENEHVALENGVEADVVNDYKKALELSKQTGKPLLIDFTGWACVNCRKMEELVWTEPSVMEYMKEHFILVSLYVDDRKQLPLAERMLVKHVDGTEKEIETVGERWAYFQSKNFKQVTQPLYVILSPEEKLLNHPVGYTPDVNEYKKWLECGVNASRSPSTSFRTSGESLVGKIVGEVRKTGRR